MTGQQMLDTFTLSAIQKTFMRGEDKPVKAIKPKGVYIVGWDGTQGAAPTIASINFFAPRSQFVRSIMGAVVCKQCGI